MRTTFVKNVPYWLYYYLPFWVRHYWRTLRNTLKQVCFDQTPDVSEETGERLGTIIRWLKEYSPQNYPGSLTFYKARAQALFSLPSDWGWKTLADCLDVQVVPGNHLSVLREPHVRVLAQRINGELKKVAGNHR
jgi:thioesterase domain-containing protein